MKRETEAKRIKENNKKRMKKTKRIKVKKTTSQKHSIQRADEHYNIRLNRIDESKIISKIIVGDCMFVRTDIETGRDFYYVKHNNVPIKVLYDSEFRAIITHDRFNVDEYNKLLELNNPKKEIEMVRSRKQSPEHTKKAAQGRCKKVINVTTGRIFNSVKAAGEFYGINPCKVSGALKGNYTKLNHEWDYYDEKEAPKQVEVQEDLEEVGKDKTIPATEKEVNNSKTLKNVDNKEIIGMIIDQLRGDEPLPVKEVVEAVQNLPKLIPVSTDKKIDSSTLLNIFKAQLNTTVQVINTIEENVELSKSKEKLEYEINELKNEYSNLINENIQINCDKNKIEIDMVKLRKMFDSLSELNTDLTAEKGCVVAELHAAYEKEHLLENEIYILKASLKETQEATNAELNSLLQENKELKEQLNNPSTLLDKMKLFFNK